MPASDVPILNAWVRLQLGPSQARALNSELAALLARYLKQPVSGNARDYLVHAAVVDRFRLPCLYRFLYFLERLGRLRESH